MPLCDATTSDPKGLRAGSLSHALWLSFLSPLGCQRMTSGEGSIATKAVIVIRADGSEPSLTLTITLDRRL